MYQVLSHNLRCRSSRARREIIKKKKKAPGSDEGQKIKQNDGISIGALALNRVAIGELSERGIFELNLDWQEGASLMKLKKRILVRGSSKCQGLRARMS